MKYFGLIICFEIIDGALGFALLKNELLQMPK